MNIEDDARRAESDDFANALRDAINAKPVTLSWLQRQLKARGNRVSMATLSYWRSGARRPEVCSRWPRSPTSRSFSGSTSAH